MCGHLHQAARGTAPHSPGRRSRAGEPNRAGPRHDTAPSARQHSTKRGRKAKATAAEPSATLARTTEAKVAPAPGSNAKATPPGTNPTGGRGTRHGRNAKAKPSGTTPARTTEAKVAAAAGSNDNRGRNKEPRVSTAPHTTANSRRSIAAANAPSSSPNTKVPKAETTTGPKGAAESRRFYHRRHGTAATPMASPATASSTDAAAAPGINTTAVATPTAPPDTATDSQALTAPKRVTFGSETNPATTKKRNGAQHRAAGGLPSALRDSLRAASTSAVASSAPRTGL